MNWPICLLLSALLLFLAACGEKEDDVTVYRSPMEPKDSSMPAEPEAARGPFQASGGAQGTSTVQSGSLMDGDKQGESRMQLLPGMAEQAAQFGEPTWELPSGWREVADPRPPRKATLIVPGEPAPADLSVTVFPGDVGGLLANINRWRREVGLAEIDQSQIHDVSSHVNVEGQTGVSHVVFLESPTPPSGSPAPAILGAIVPGADHTWFFKLKGPVSVLEAESDRFRTFLSSVRLPE